MGCLAVLYYSIVALVVAFLFSTGGLGVVIGLVVVAVSMGLHWFVWAIASDARNAEEAASSENPADIGVPGKRDAYHMTDAVVEAHSAAGHAASARRERTHDPIYRSEYLSPEDEERYVVVDENDMPNLRLKRERGQLVLTVPQGMVSFRSRRIYRLGIYAFRVRGTSYYPDAVRAGSLSPGSEVELDRESDNEHDPNAVAIYSSRPGDQIGYANRQNAARIAKRLDAGEELEAITMTGSRAGRDDGPVTVLVASPALMAHLRRKA